MLRALQGQISFDQNPFIQSIWFPKRKLSWSKHPVPPTSLGIYLPSKRDLNVSQKTAVNTILSDADTHRITLIQGPPGTGKTTVIAASVLSVMASLNTTNTLWLVAQSNVAVKNIAEKLAIEDFLNFKILVSKDFHFDWYVYFPRQLTVCFETFLLGMNISMRKLNTTSSARTSSLTVSSSQSACYRDRG